MLPYFYQVMWSLVSKEGFIFFYVLPYLFSSPELDDWIYSLQGGPLH